MNFLQLMEAINPEALYPTEHKDSIIGIANRGDKVVFVLDMYSIIDRLIAGGMGFDEAEEYYWYNIEGAYMGENTPYYVEDNKEEDL